MKIKKIKNCIEGGHRSWFLCTCDYSSLEARLASIDTCLNPEGLDQTLYNVYKDGSKVSDLHSMTGFGTFVDSVKMKGIHVHDTVTNKDYVFAPTSNVLIKKADGTQKKVQAQYLEESDTILEYL